MQIPKEVLSDLKEKYLEAEKLIEEESKFDPPTEPFRSHYLAKDILVELQNNIKNSMQSSDDRNPADDQLKFKFILGHVIIDLGKICMFTEEISTAERYLQDGIDLLSEYNLHPSGVCAYLNGLNQIGILWTNRSDVPKAKDFLIKAEQIYDDFKLLNISPHTIYDLFGTKDEIEKGKGDKMLDKINTLTLFYLAQIFGSLGDLQKSAVYCHTTLKKQLLLHDYDSIDWALNAATLSQYFCTNCRYKEARHHLAAATQILEEFEKVMIKPEMTDDEKNSIEETFKHRSADVARCWLKYGLNLLSDSRDRLLEDKEVSSFSDLNVTTPLTFGTLIDPAYENVITHRYVLDMDDAKPVFVAIQQWIEKAKSYYTPETEASEYSKIVQDHAIAYKHLAFFESNSSNQAKMHKRRVDLLEELNELLNKVFYMNIVREILYELGSAYSNILDIKLDALDEAVKSNTPNPHALKKINDLCTKCRNYFAEFISTYYVARTEILRTDLNVDELISIAFAYFQMARIWYKYITPDKTLQTVYASNCLENYQKFIALCGQHKEVGDKMKAEVSVSKEMVMLLPLKIQRLKEMSTPLPAITA